MSQLDHTGELSLDDADFVWELLTERIEALTAAWDKADEPPQLASFVPERPAAVRRLALVELIKIDLEYRWTDQRAPQRIEDYVSLFPELEDEGGVPVDLLYEEYHIRRRAEDQVDTREYFSRFPQREDDLRRLLGMEDSNTTTALFTPKPPEPVEVGESLDDFDLLTSLGKGAFATVFLARQRSMQRLVALKVSADRGSEPQTLAQLDHPHIVRVYDQRRLPDRGQRLLYMQYLAGGTLQDAIRHARDVPPSERGGCTLLAAIDKGLDDRGESPPIDSSLRAKLESASWSEVVCWMGMCLADALEYAHTRGVLHRDLKPANILMTSEGAPKLVDFNISFCSKVDGASPAAYFGGSLAYMSPEQLEACNPRHDSAPEDLGPTSDVYALGVVLWELLTMRRPFEEEQLEAGWGSMLGDMSLRRRNGLGDPAIDNLPSDCPDGLKEVLLKCLAPHEEDRYASAGEAAAELRLCLHPEAHRLLRAPERGWIALVRRYSILSLVMTALLPNALAGAFNYVYNREQVVMKLPDKEALAVFDKVQFAVNGIAFPLGIAILVSLFFPVARCLRRLGLGEAVAADELMRARQRCLKMGQYTAMIGIIEWTIAGMVYPIAMHVAGATLGAGDYLHFFLSLVTCGLIAAAYPFFGAAALAVHGWFPPLFDVRTATQDDRIHLGWLNRAIWVYLGIAALVPMLAVVLALSLPGKHFTTIVLGAASMAGLLLIFGLARLLEKDLAALAEVIGKSKESLDT